jgi:hypothetical protein
MLNSTFNNISAISWWSVLLVEETGVPGKNHWPIASHWQTLSDNVVIDKIYHIMLYRVHSTWAGFELKTLVVIDTDCIGSYKSNKGNAKRGVSPRLKIWPSDLDLWPWKSIGFQIFLRTKYVPSLVKIHWRMLILECSQGCYVQKNLTRWPWPLTLKINKVSDFLKD